PDPAGPLLAEALPGGLVRVWSGTLTGELSGPDGERWTSCPAGDVCLPAPGTRLTDPDLALTVAPRAR
ncbi:MAG: hypothetical protein M3P93_13095, partial [Actinomycetota bacterium]|nr:hypothetical protein [Actinomycetota bacterium]